MSLAGKVVLVVEGQPYIAQVLCGGLAAQGCSVVHASAMSTATGPSAGGQEAGWVSVDVTDVSSTEAMVSAVLDRFGRIDVLINGGSHNAAAQRAPFFDIAQESWDRCFAQAARGMWLCCRAVAPSMKQRRSGRVITIGSTAAWSGEPGLLHYATASSALVGMTRSLARELGDFGISVNMVCLDPAASTEAAGTGTALRRTPSPQQPGVCRPVLPGPTSRDSVLGPVLFLAGDDSDFITGQSYLVNGGAWMQ
jgi:NAD(P)-dependent dehydrogenase (short-subunit alcohol dehydrogenase family)